MAKSDPSRPHPQLVRFGKDLRAARRRAKLSQDELARLSGVSQGEISVIEAGAREPGILRVICLARALHMEPADLVRRLR